MSHHFGLHPWDLDRLAPLELDAYLDALADLAKEATSGR